MKLCSEWHEEVCFDGDKCPACKVIEDTDDKILALQDRVEQLEKEVCCCLDRIKPIQA